MRGVECYKAIDGQEALTDFVKEHAPLVKKIALQIKSRVPQQIELDDLLQSGLTGLLEARNTYSAAENASFSTWAYLKIQCAMFDFLRKSTGMTRELSQHIKKVDEARKALENSCNTPVAARDVAEALGVSMVQFAKISGEISTYKALSVQEPETTDDIACEKIPTPHDSHEHEHTRRTLKSMLETLPKREQILLSLYYNEDISFREIGDILGLTEARISQLHSACLEKMRRRFLSHSQRNVHD